jgi:hypothetical protein
MGYDNRIKKVILEIADVDIKFVPCTDLHKYRHILHLSKFTTDDKYLKQSIKELFSDFKNRLVPEETYVQPCNPVGDILFFPIVIGNVPARFVMVIENGIYIVKLDSFYL